jgi:hypothetical protein
MNEDEREIGWTKEMWKRRDRMEKERGKNVIIFFWIRIIIIKSKTCNDDKFKKCPFSRVFYWMQKENTQQERFRKERTKKNRNIDYVRI